VNAGESWPSLSEAKSHVLRIQTKLNQWALDDPDRCFNDLFNLVYDPAVLVEAWGRIGANRGARSAGVDGHTVRYISARYGEQAFLSALRDDLKARTFQPMPVREAMIPKTGDKRRRLGIPTVRDRVVQAALKTVLEPIWEADFQPCSYGFRPRRRAHDAIAEIHYYTSRTYEWVVDADIEACFDNISHSALLERIRKRVGDKRVVALIKSFLKAGVLSEDGMHRDTVTGAPQGAILSPLLSNIALSVLDDHFMQAWEAMGGRSGRETQRRNGKATYRLVRYADDWLLMVAGTEAHAESLRDEAAAVLAPMGLALSEQKTAVAHIDRGFDFLGMHIQRHKQRGSERRYVYIYPTKAALQAVKAKVKTATTRRTTNLPLSALIHHLNRVLRGWTAYHRHAASARTFSYLASFTWWRVWRWLRKKHPHATVAELRRRYYRNNRWWPEHDGAELFNAGKVTITRYRYRGTAIPTPWAGTTKPD